MQSKQFLISLPKPITHNDKSNDITVPNIITPLRVTVNKKTVSPLKIHINLRSKIMINKLNPSYIFYNIPPTIYQYPTC